SDEREVRDRRVSRGSEGRVETGIEPAEDPVEREPDPGRAAEQLMIRSKRGRIELAERAIPVARREDGAVADQECARQVPLLATFATSLCWPFEDTRVGRSRSTAGT